MTCSSFRGHHPKVFLSEADADLAGADPSRALKAELRAPERIPMVRAR